jgi:predicted permease
MIRRRPDLDDLDREIRDHIERETEDNLARGMSEADARAAAVRKFGNITRVKEDVRGVWIPGWLDRLRQDARDAARQVRRNPAFSLAIVVTLALGIGLTTAIYSVVNAVLLRPLDYANPDRVVWLTARGKEPIEIANSIDFAVWNEQAASLAHTVAYDYSDSTLVLGGEASRVRVVGASNGFWEVTGARPLFGALPPTPEPPTVVLSHHVFREQFHSDPNVIGQAVTIDGRDATVAAVLPEDYRPQLVGRPFDPAFNQVEIGAYRVIPVQPPPQVISPTTQVRIYEVPGRAQAGRHDRAGARRDRGDSQSLATRASHADGAVDAIVVPLREKIVGPSRPALGVLLSASIIVLLIACANVANLLLSRSSERRKEIALRMSIGSSPMRIIRQLLAESLGYSIIGGLGAVLFAYWLVNAVVVIIGAAVPRLAETTLDVSVLAVAAAISIGTAILFGVGPAIALIFTNVQEVLKEGGRSVSASRRVLVTGRIMVAAQVALTVVLLAGAGLMFKSVWQMTRYADGSGPINC